MSEKRIEPLARHEAVDHAETHAHHERVHKHITEQAERARHEKSHENIHKIQELARAEAQESHKVAVHEQPKDHHDSWVGTHASLKTTAYRRTLQKTQQKLPKPARVFSKFVHQDTIEKLSAISAQTVARPSGILGGSFTALLGSVIVLYLSKHYGFEYNFTLMLVLFVGGFCLGAALELLVWLAYGRKRRYR
jgi:hypothetical protein